MPELYRTELFASPTRGRAQPFHGALSRATRGSGMSAHHPAGAGKHAPGAAKGAPAEASAGGVPAATGGALVSSAYGADDSPTAGKALLARLCGAAALRRCWRFAANWAHACLSEPARRTRGPPLPRQRLGHSPAVRVRAAWLTCGPSRARQSEARQRRSLTQRRCSARRRRCAAWRGRTRTAPPRWRSRRAPPRCTIACRTGCALRHC